MNATVDPLPLVPPTVSTIGVAVGVVGVAAHDEGRAGGNWRDGGDFRQPFQAGLNLLPLVD